MNASDMARTEVGHYETYYWAELSRIFQAGRFIMMLWKTNHVGYKEIYQRMDIIYKTEKTFHQEECFNRYRFQSKSRWIVTTVEEDNKERNIMTPRQDGCHFAEDIFSVILLKNKIFVS